MNDRRRQCPVDDLQVSGISDHEWRVADGRLGDESPGKVLGFIQRRGAAFEVLDLDAPDRDIVIDDWLSAVQFFSTDRRAKGTSAVGGDKGALHGSR